MQRPGLRGAGLATGHQGDASRTQRRVVAPTRWIWLRDLPDPEGRFVGSALTSWSLTGPSPARGEAPRCGTWPGPWIRRWCGDWTQKTPAGATCWRLGASMSCAQADPGRYPAGVSERSSATTPAGPSTTRSARARSSAGTSALAAHTARPGTPRRRSSTTASKAGRSPTSSPA